MSFERYDIFLSYRRDGGYATAKHLYDLLTRDGYAVSFDIDTLRNGDFDVELLKRIDECTDFVLILNKEAFDRTLDPTFRRENDWLRNELAHALALNKNVIPIMLSGFTEFPANLPDDIAKVAKKNGPKYDQYYFDDFYRKLKEVFLDSSPRQCAEAAAKGVGATCGVRVRSNINFDLFVDGKYVERVNADTLHVVDMTPGEYIFEFVSIYDGGVDKVEIKQRVGADTPILDVDLKSVKEKREATEKAALPEIRQRYTQTTHPVFECGLCNVRVNGLEGYVDVHCKEVVPCIYSYCSGFSEVTLLCIIKRQGKYGVIDSKGKELLPPVFDAIENAYDIPDSTLLRVVKNGKCGIMDADSGEVTLPLAYDGISKSVDDRCIVRSGKELGIFDTASRKWALECGSYDSITLYAGGFAVLKRDDKEAAYMLSTGCISDFAYDSISPLSEGLAAVKRDGRHGFINTQCELCVPLKLDGCKSFHDGLAPVCVKGKWGYMNHEYKLEIPLQYDSATAFLGGRSIVSAGNTSGIIDLTGKVIYPLTAETQFYCAVGNRQGSILARRGNSWQLVDFCGNVMTTQVTDCGDNMYVANDEVFFGFDYSDPLGESYDLGNTSLASVYGVLDTDELFENDDDDGNDDTFFGDE